jgi:serine/threonine protein kinase
MRLFVGEKLGPYEIVALIGAGGMGEVYRARDVNLKRDVALKILSPQFASDPERVARFQREAEVLASLNHSNIASLYGVAEAEGTRALVMEFVEGESPSGPMPFEDAWKIMAQVADGLEYAHERRIVHRDLKPSNLKVTSEGRVKILDFGLAKALASTGPQSASAQGSDSPTLTMGATQAGVILGTAAYMAPEQIKGKEADRRADIWAFGVVLYELLSGERPFKGKDSTEIMAHAVTTEPSLEKAPSKVRRLLTECLKKEPEERLRWVGDAGRLLEEPAESRGPAGAKASVAGSSPLHKLLWPVAAGVLAVAAATVSFVHFREQQDTHSLRYTIEAPPNTRFSSTFYGTAASPDGRLLVFTSSARNGSAPAVWLRPMDSLAARALPGTEGGNGMFWSPDSKSVGFFASNQLKRLDVLGGTPQVLCDTPNEQGGTWSQDGTVLVSAAGVIQRVPAAGGAPTPVTTLDASRQETAHLFPYFLPDGNTFLFTILSGNPNTQGIYVASLSAPRQRIRLAATPAKALYAPPRDGWPGYLLWLRDQTLVAQRFDGKARLEGDPIPAADQVDYNDANHRAAFWISNTGLLMYRSGGGATLQLHSVGRDGKREVITGAGDDKQRGNPLLSPDGTRLALDRTASSAASNTRDVWLYEFARGVMTRLTTGPGNNDVPVWSPDGRWVAFRSDRDGSQQIYRKETTGTGQDERLTQGPNPKTPLDWSRDGRYILYQEQDSKTAADIWALPLEGDRKPIPILNTPFTEQVARFSPDGKWIAYASNKTGRAEIYIRSFPPSAGEWQVSNNGATEPRWRADGKELYYYVGGGTGNIWAAGIRTGAGQVVIDPPHELPVPYGRFSGTIHYDVMRDGQRFLMIQSPTVAGDESAAALTVVSNWQAGLRQ